MLDVDAGTENCRACLPAAPVVALSRWNIICSSSVALYYVKQHVGRPFPRQPSLPFSPSYLYFGDSLPVSVLFYSFCGPAGLKHLNFCRVGRHANLGGVHPRRNSSHLRRRGRAAVPVRRIARVPPDSSHGVRRAAARPPDEPLGELRLIRDPLQRKGRTAAVWSTKNFTRVRKDTIPTYNPIHLFVIHTMKKQKPCGLPIFG